MSDLSKPEGKSLSFGFKKKIETKVDKSKVIIEKTDEIEKEVLDEVNDDILNKKEKKKELIIPLIKKNKWNLSAKNSDQENNENSNLEEKAAREIMTESAKFLEKSISNHDDEFDDLSVPLLMKNKVPEGFETDDKLNVDIRPDEASLENYQAIPVEAFGMALLRGMGWDPKVGIGKTFKQNVKTLEVNLRPKGLGLGATAPEPGAERKQNHRSSKEETALEIKIGAYVKVKEGSHKKKYGVIEGLDVDNSQCVVKFALGGKTASIVEFNLEAVSKSEYTRYGKDLSRLTKAHEELEKRKQLDGNDRPRSSKAEHHIDRRYSDHKQSRKYDSSDQKYNEHRRSQRYDSPDRHHRFSREQGEANYDRRRKRDYEVSSTSTAHREYDSPLESSHKHRKHKKAQADSPEFRERKSESERHHKLKKEKHKKSKKEKNKKSKKEKHKKYDDYTSSSS